MDCFYIITNKLKIKIMRSRVRLNNIFNLPVKMFLSEKTVRAILFRELFLRKQNADWY